MRPPLSLENMKAGSLQGLHCLALHAFTCRQATGTLDVLDVDVDCVTDLLVSSAGSCTHARIGLPPPRRLRLRGTPSVPDTVVADYGIIHPSPSCSESEPAPVLLPGQASIGQSAGMPSGSGSGLSTYSPSFLTSKAAMRFHHSATQAKLLDRSEGRASGNCTSRSVSPTICRKRWAYLVQCSEQGDVEHVRECRRRPAEIRAIIQRIRVERQRRYGPALG